MPVTLSYFVIASFNRRAGQLGLQLTFSSDHVGYISGIWVARKPESSNINRATPSPSFSVNKHTLDTYYTFLSKSNPLTDLSR